MKTCIPLSTATVAAALLMPVCLPAAAQGSALLKNVFVTATRVEQGVSDVLADVSVIDRAQIDASGASSVTQLLGRLPGLQAISFGDASRVYVRGADSRMTALYVDGVRVDSQDGLLLGGGVRWEMLPLSQIERIEVLRGPASAVYGSDAMGGVVQIFTKRGASGLAPTLELSLGSLNTKKLSAGLSGAQGGWDFAIGLGLEDSDGYNTRPDLQHLPEREASSSRAASLRLGYRIAPSQRVEVVALDSRLDSRYVPWNGGADFQARSDMSTAALKWEAQWSDGYSSRLTLSSSRVAKRDDVPYDYRTTLQGVLLENNFRLSTGTLTAVLEQKRDQFDSEPSGYYDPAFRGQRTQNAIAFGYGAHYGQHAVQMNLRHDDDNLFGGRQTGALSYAYLFAPDWRAGVAGGTAFRAPTLEQVFGPYGSAALAPETNRNSELTLGYASATTSFKTVAYRNVISNMISSSAALSSCEAGFFCYYNVGQATLRGLTISASRRLDRYDLRASLDLLDPIDNGTGRVLSLRARRGAMLGLGRSLAGWKIGAEIQGVSERFDDAANSTVLPGYGLLNLTANTQLGRDWQLVMRVDNAIDAQYQQVGHYATPGRTFNAALQWRPKS
ncbi:MAG: TonB-dependent receptor domain-containing protein [Rhodoferax sp.]